MSRYSERVAGVTFGQVLTGITIGVVILAYSYEFVLIQPDAGNGALAAGVCITPYLILAYAVLKVHRNGVLVLAWVLISLNAYGFATLINAGGAQYGATGIVFVPLVLISWIFGIATLVLVAAGMLTNNVGGQSHDARDEKK